MRPSTARNRWMFAWFLSSTVATLGFPETRGSEAPATSRIALYRALGVSDALPDMQSAALQSRAAAVQRVMGMYQAEIARESLSLEQRKAKLRRRAQDQALEFEAKEFEAWTAGDVDKVNEFGAERQSWQTYADDLRPTPPTRTPSAGVPSGASETTTAGPSPQTTTTARPPLARIEPAELSGKYLAGEILESDIQDYSVLFRYDVTDRPAPEAKEHLARLLEGARWAIDPAGKEITVELRNRNGAEYLNRYHLAGQIREQNGVLTFRLGCKNLLAGATPNFLRGAILRTATENDNTRVVEIVVDCALKRSGRRIHVMRGTVAQTLRQTPEWPATTPSLGDMSGEYVGGPLVHIDVLAVDKYRFGYSPDDIRQGRPMLERAFQYATWQITPGGKITLKSPDSGPENTGERFQGDLKQQAGDQLLWLFSSKLSSTASFGGHLVRSPSGLEVELQGELEQRVDGKALSTQFVLRQRLVRARGRLGVLTQKDSSPPLVHEVVANGPAALAGLRAGDTILTVGGVAVKSHIELVEVLARHAPGVPVEMEYERGGQRSSVAVRLTPTP